MYIYIMKFIDKIEDYAGWVIVIVTIVALGLLALFTTLIYNNLHIDQYVGGFGKGVISFLGAWVLLGIVGIIVQLITFI